MTTNFTGFVTAQISGNFSGGGSGKYKPLKRKNSDESKDQQNAFNPFKPKYNRMAFKSSKDPVYLAFDYVENQSLSKITSEFVRENIKDPLNKLYSKLTNAFA